jgi:ribosomal protein S19E (S16A)
LASLEAMGLIESRIDGRNMVRWHLTHKGRSLLDGITATASPWKKSATPVCPAGSR